MPLVRKKQIASKSGSLLPAAFSGNPKIAAVAFGSAYVSTYAVSVDIETSGMRAFTHTIKNITASGFQIELCANNIAGLVRVSWQTQAEGES